MRILVGMDFSSATDIVTTQACKLAKAFSAELWLVHVAPPDPDFVGYAPGPQVVRDQVAEELREEHARLQRESEAIGKQGIQTSWVMLQGPIAESLLGQAEKLAAEMIVIGSHGHGAVYELVVGSTCQAVLHKAKCPVLVVPAHSRK